MTTMTPSTRVLYLTVRETGCPMDISSDLRDSWVRDWCCRHNATYYTKPRTSFSYAEAKAQAIRNRCNTVVMKPI